MKRISAGLVAVLVLAALTHSPSARAQVADDGLRYPGGPDSLIDLYVTVVVDTAPEAPVAVPHGMRETPPIAKADLLPPHASCGSIETMAVLIDGPWDHAAAETRAVQIARVGLRHFDESDNRVRLYPANRIRLVEFRAHE